MENNIVFELNYSIFVSFILSTIISFILYDKLKAKDEKKNHKKSKEMGVKKIGLLTNEIPPIIYGGVSTWIINFMKMFDEDETCEVVPIFLAYADRDISVIKKKYKDIRIIENPGDIVKAFEDIDVCVNNLWIALDTIKQIKTIYPELAMVSVCHSLIKMEHLTNLGSQYTNNYYDQEITFQYSDFVVLISEAEKKYYNEFGYNKYDAETVVIYNSYKPKFDNIKLDVDYENNNIGYLGRHVPRKRPELPLMGVLGLNKDIQVYNMGVDYNKYGNDYWKKLEKEHEGKLNVIPFSSDKSKIAGYWKNVGANCITGIYEPFGYTMCETLDRRVPAIVQDIDGPSEIISGKEDKVYIYNVDKKDMKQDIENFKKALGKFWKTSPEDRKNNCEEARKALDNFRPEVIKEKWKVVLEKCAEGNFKKKNMEDHNYLSFPSYGYFRDFKQLLWRYFIHEKTGSITAPNQKEITI